MDKNLTTVKKLYNQFKKSPHYKKLSYPYFKFLLMRRLEEMPVPGKAISFVFDPGRAYHYLQLNVSVLDILKTMKISKKEFIARYREKEKGVSGVLDG